MIRFCYKARHGEVFVRCPQNQKEREETEYVLNFWKAVMGIGSTKTGLYVVAAPEIYGCKMMISSLEVPTSISQDEEQKIVVEVARRLLNDIGTDRNYLATQRKTAERAKLFAPNVCHHL